MLPTTLDAPDQPPEDHRPPRAIVTLPSRDQLTAIQMGTLLHAAAMLSPLLASEFDESEGRSIVPAKSEVSVAAENTITTICERIQTLVEDTDRWTLKAQRSLEDDLSAVYKGHLELIAEQKIAVKSVNLPHKTAGVKLCHLQDNSLWAAVLGDPKTGDCIVGIGETPADALKDFDREFTEKPTKHNEQPESKLPLDPGASSDTPSKPPTKRRVARNREHPRPDGEIM